MDRTAADHHAGARRGGRRRRLHRVLHRRRGPADTRRSSRDGRGAGLQKSSAGLVLLREYRCRAASEGDSAAPKCLIGQPDPAVSLGGDSELVVQVLQMLFDGCLGNEQLASHPTNRCRLRKRVVGDQRAAQTIRTSSSRRVSRGVGRVGSAGSADAGLLTGRIGNRSLSAVEFGFPTNTELLFDHDHCTSTGRWPTK